MFQNAPNEFILNLETALFSDNQWEPDVQNAIMYQILLPANLFDAWLWEMRAHWVTACTVDYVLMFTNRVHCRLCTDVYKLRAL